jgi:hypothetical protein
MIARALIAILAAAGLAAPVLARAQEAPTTAPFAEARFMSDNADFRAMRLRAGALLPYDNPWHYAGVAAQTSRYWQDGYRKEAEAILGFYRDQRRDTLAGLELEAGVARVSGHLRPVGDATWRFVPTPGLAIDAIATADLVETPLALDRGIGHTFAAAGVERTLGERFTVTGLAGRQWFTDGNARNHLRARLIALVLPEAGVTLQLRYRQYDSMKNDVGGAYFNPDHEQQWLGVAAIRKRYAGWMFHGELGAGQERSTGGGSRPARHVEARVEGPLFGTVRVVLRAGYERSAGFIDATGYSYRLLSAELQVPLR